MLPRRLPKADKRPGRWKSPAHCNFVRDHHCCVPGCDNRPIGESSFESAHGINMAALADAFAKSSPKKADIVKAKRERGL